MMKNCLVLGSGRSGTSMLSGILFSAGYFMGENLYPPRLSNPKGFFEAPEINNINEIILSKYDRPYPRILEKFIRLSGSGMSNWQKMMPSFLKRFFYSTVYRPIYLQRWLMSLPVHINVTCDSKKIRNRIRKLMDREPFCFKDPRFCYTLPIWRHHLEKNTVFICVFREPNVTVKSILKQHASPESKYLHTLHINEKEAYEVWQNQYSHVLKKHIKDNADKFFFVHYNQIYDGSALLKLSEMLDVELKHDFVSKKLKRTKSDSQIPQDAEKIYNKLCELSGYNE